MKVKFNSLLQDSQDLGSDDEHMVSRVFFDLEFRGETFIGLHADVKQTVGARFESAPLEVSKPDGYHGPFPVPGTQVGGHVGGNRGL